MADREDPTGRALTLASRHPPALAGVEVTTRRVTVVQDADTGVLVHRVETALVARTLRVARKR